MKLDVHFLNTDFLETVLFRLAIDSSYNLRQYDLSDVEWDRFAKTLV